jgi:hypothetical protein
MENENEFVAVGDTDVSNDPTPFVLVRSLQPRVTEQLLANGIAKLYRSAEKQAPQPASKSESALQVTATTTSTGNVGATEGSIKRAFIVRDRRNNRSQGFGLVEFHSVEVSQIHQNCPVHSLIHPGCTSSTQEVRYRICWRTIHHRLKASISQLHP